MKISRGVILPSCCNARVRLCGIGFTLACAIAGLLPNAAAAADQEVHVATGGDDKNDGSADSPMSTLGAALKRLKEGGAVVLHGGTYTVSEQLEIVVKRATIRPAAGETVVLAHGEFDGSVLLIIGEGVTIEGLTIDGKFVTKARGIRGRNTSARLTIRNCEVKNCANHAIDVDGSDCRIEDCHIHHNLWWDKTTGERDDAHGIATKFSQGLLIRNCRIHHVSGDCFQCDRGAWQNITIEDCDFSNGALEEDMGGFKKGASPGEDGIDTKIINGKDKGRLIVRRCKFHDFRSSFIGTPAAMNLKENVDVVVDSCEFTNAVVALRLRGTGRGVMWPAVVNCTFRGCDVAVRYEDNLQKLRLVHNTFAECRTLFQRAPAKTGWGSGWVVANNLFVDLARFPEEARSTTNAAISKKLVDADTLRPTGPKRPVGKPVAGAVPVWYGPGVEVDHAGKDRPKDAPTMGAYEVIAEEGASEK